MDKNSKQLKSQSKKSEPKKKSAVVSAEKKVNSKESKKIVEVKASAKFVKVGPRKVRLVIDQLRGMEAEAALTYLKFTHKSAVLPIMHLLKSALANADHNYKLDSKDLYIKSIIANEGPVLKRWQPKAHGRATTIRKKTSHIHLILGAKEGAQIKVGVKKDEKGKREEVKVLNPNEIKKEAPKHSGRGPKESGGEQKGFLKGMFQRKTG